jgi:hypothetical protein
MSKDLRLSERFAVKWKIRFLSPEVSCNARTADVSQNGASFHSDVAIPQSIKATVTISLPPSGLFPKGQEISMHARVVYCILQGKDGFRIGMEFTHVDDKVADILSKKLKHLAEMNNDFK